MDVRFKIPDALKGHFLTFCNMRMIRRIKTEKKLHYRKFVLNIFQLTYFLVKQQENKNQGDILKKKEANF